MAKDLEQNYPDGVNVAIYTKFTIHKKDEYVTDPKTGKKKLKHKKNTGDAEFENKAGAIIVAGAACAP